MHDVWVTPTRGDERWPAGDYVNQSAPGQGLPAWTEQDRPVADTQITVWHSFGHNHIPRPEDYPVLVKQVTAERVKEHFRELCRGRVERFELPNLNALNFLLYEALDGGGTVSLRTDAQGKTLSAALLRMEIEV